MVLGARHLVSPGHRRGCYEYITSSAVVERELRPAGHLPICNSQRVGEHDALPLVALRRARPARRRSVRQAASHLPIATRFRAELCVGCFPEGQFDERSELPRMFSRRSCGEAFVWRRETFRHHDALAPMLGPSRLQVLCADEREVARREPLCPRIPVGNLIGTGLDQRQTDKSAVSRDAAAWICACEGRGRVGPSRRLHPRHALKARSRRVAKGAGDLAAETLPGLRPAADRVRGAIRAVGEADEAR